MLRYDFSRHEPARVGRAAQQLATDVRWVMLNSGGPMVARTVHPILHRNHDDLGLSIAVVPSCRRPVGPSAVTVASIQLTFKMHGYVLPPRWAAGKQQQASVTLAAEQFCLGCHVKAAVGGALGTVHVRSDLKRKETLWWQEVRPSAGALSLKIPIHAIHAIHAGLLFLLLKVRMEPLLALRSTVSSLAQGVMDLSPRAMVTTADEFCELAQKLNHLLGRIGVVVSDLDKILAKVVAVCARLGALNRDLEPQVDGMRGAQVRLLGDGAQRSPDTQWLAAREGGVFHALA